MDVKVVKFNTYPVKEKIVKINPFPDFNNRKFEHKNNQKYETLTNASQYCLDLVVKPETSSEISTETNAQILNKETSQPSHPVGYQIT